MSNKDDETSTVKMSGYLEKKCNKMKMMSSWKLKWFVLKGRLLLYYRSKDEYESLSPCKGSINLGPTCAVKPLLGTSCVFQIETRARTIVLKAKSRLDQEKWLQAILSVLNQGPIAPSTGIVHFRYSSDDLTPRHIIDTHNRLTRQNTMPTERYKTDKRKTFCGSVENVLQRESIDIKPKYSSSLDITSKNIYGAIIKSARRSEEIINDLYAVGEKSQEVNTKQGKSGENLYYRISSDSNNSTKDKLAENDIYVIEARTKPKENVYSKITWDYVTQEEMNRSEVEKEVIIENDQYCTTAIKVMETKDANYHEYNIPQKDNIYSIPNVDLNENRIPKCDDVGPYSICNIYPKHQEQQPEEVIYDSPLEVILEKPKTQGNVEESAGRCEEEHKPQLPKKRSFLKKFFKLRTRKKSDADEEDNKKDKEERKVNDKVPDVDVISRNVLEELQRLLIAKREALKQPQVEPLKLDTQLATKKMLEELQRLLVNKKDNLKLLLNSTNSPVTCQRIPETVYQEITEAKPERSSRDNNTNEHIYENTGSRALVKIDKILNDLDNMKKASKPFTTSKVKNIIAKFNSLEIADIKETDEEPVVLREKSNKDVDLNFANSKNSNDELNLLLSELAKVTNAPILTPGVTSSLDVAPTKSDEFGTLDKSKLRRHSDPDYDIPRPHTNLHIIKTEVETDDSFVATRFFGPVLSNYGGVNSITPTSITPDSLEVTPCTSEVGSYHSHAYGKIKQKPYYLHKQPRSVEGENKEIFIDSLDIETATPL